MTRRSLRGLCHLVWTPTLITVGLLSGLAVHAQSVAGPTPSLQFSVASVKPGDPSVSSDSFEYRPEAGEFDSNSATLTQLIGFAYDVRAHQIVGGQNWRNSTGFTIDAKAENSIPDGPAGTQMFRSMLRALLAEHFHLVVHEETRQAPVYELIVGKDGSKLKQGTEVAGGVRTEPGRLIGTATPMFLLVNQLSRQLGRTVIDNTGLHGKYDFNLRWEPDSFGRDTPPSDSPGPSIFTAVQEDLGLKLQPTKGPVSSIVIERMEKPDPN